MSATITTPTRLNLVARAETELSRSLRFPVPRPLLQWITALDQTEDLWREVLAASGPSIFDRVLSALDVRYRCSDSDLARIPASGPAVITSNHPFGLLDGLIAGSLIHRRRRDFRILANSMVASIPEIDQFVIPVSVINRDTQANGPALRSALRWLRSGGALVIFPAGEVSALRGLPPSISDPEWNSRIIELAVAARASVTPVHMSGSNSAAFQCAGLIHPMLRTALLGRELMNKRGYGVDIAVGQEIAAGRLAQFGSDRLGEYVRDRSYLLAERRVPAKFFRFKQPATPRPLAAPVPAEVLSAEVSALPEDARLLSSGGYSIYVAAANRIPAVLEEIGRLRECTFRAVGEGTGRARDIDSFDDHYEHLFLWNHEKQEIAGAYRIGRVDQLVQRFGPSGLYTQQLFQLTPEFLNRVHDGLELGRSFVRQEYQRSVYPLYYLWKGIATFAARNPRYRHLFGPVSISNEYSRAARELIVRYFRSRRSNGNSIVRPRRPFHPRPFGAQLTSAMAEHAADVEELSALIADLEPDGKGIPVLLRHYLGLGAEVLEFNVDRAFSNVLDALIVVDLARSNNRALEKYMGKENFARYLAYHRPPAPAAAF